MTATTTSDVRLTPELGLATWHSLGTYVHLTVTDRAALSDATDIALDVLDQVDTACSRFRPDSDLSRVNRAGGRHTVSPVLIGAVRLALEAAQDTDGLVDPTLGELLVAAGYDRTFTQLPSVGPDPGALPVPPASWRQIRVVDDVTLEVPDHAGLDLGATGKAYAADLVARLVAQETGSGVLASLGGDIATVDDGPWPVTIATTRARLDAGDVTTTVLLPGGLGLSTSSVLARGWVAGGSRWHHLLDPRSGRPADGPWVSVTAFGHTATSANVATTAAIVLGADALGWLEQRGVAALLVAADGRTTRTTGWLELAPEQRR